MTKRSDAALQALGDPTRRQILLLLGEGPRSVREISDELPVTRPAVSHHLGVLRDADLVKAEVDGTRRIYRVEPAGLKQIQAFMEEVWGTALSRLKIVAENPPKRKKRKRGDAGDS